MLPEVELAKKEGNDAFVAKDYESALKHYTEAMQLDPSEFTLPLNRCFANLKLERWKEAEDDADTALGLSTEAKMKAYYRRNIARREQGKFHDARQGLFILGSEFPSGFDAISLDVWSFLDAGGRVKDAINEHSMIASAETRAVRATMTTAECGFNIVETQGRGLGAFASCDFHRGDLILVEAPLYSVREHSTGTPRPRDILAAIKCLDEASLNQYLTLKNSMAARGNNESSASVDDTHLIGIYGTNAIATGEDDSSIFLLASRFNHSCRPNARYSWHAASRALRIYALQDIPEGQEIMVSYIAGRNVYGSTKAERFERLNVRYGFYCACEACSLPSTVQAESDGRRKELARLWASIPYFSPHQTDARLRAIARGVRLMQEEGYTADADDFTNDAAAICAYHGDWDSVTHWARKTYESRLAEFGGDSRRALDTEICTLLADPKRHSMAGSGRKMVFSVRI
ncbi:hypothetical protein OF83DRAFT_1109832 [Amylostereum chailletii]|nr:hypothetical protein OF83DRAFT_1109832 [Amylostereum chailletii]